MRIPFKIQFRDMDESDFVYNDIWEHVEKLERYYDHILSCNVVVSLPHHSPHRGKVFQIQVRLHVPGSDLVVTTDSGNEAYENIYVAVRDAFDAVKRRLEDFVAVQKGMVKKHRAL